MSKKIEILNSHLQKIDRYIPYFQNKNLDFSNVSVGWQLDHALKVINGVSVILAKTDPKKFKKDFNIRRSIIFTIGFIPRGRAKAPKQVLPPEIITEEDLYAQLKTAQEHIKTIDKVDENAFFIHHIFGNLNKAQTLRFLDIHTNHHLKIVEDIIKNK